MSQGRLNKRVEFQRLAQERNAKGRKNTGDWETVFSVWAEIKPMSSQESEINGRIKTARKTQIKIHFREGVSSALRIVRGSRVFLIEGVVNDRESNRYLICDCLEQI